MKKVKKISKKGMTLVELVVTIAILGMVASLGVGMVSSAIRNYSVATTTSVEQKSSLAIESFIASSGRVCGEIKTLEFPVEGKHKVIDDTATAFYLYFDGDDLLTVRNEVEKGIPYKTTLSYQDVEHVRMRVRKQKPEKTDYDEDKAFVFIEYEIQMGAGYTLNGTAVMNNASSEYSITVEDSKLIDSNEWIMITKDSNYAIAIVK